MERTANASAAAAENTNSLVPRLARSARVVRSPQSISNGHRATSWFKALRPLIASARLGAAPAAQTTGCRSESAGRPAAAAARVCLRRGAHLRRRYGRAKQHTVGPSPSLTRSLTLEPIPILLVQLLVGTFAVRTSRRANNASRKEKHII